MFSLNSGTPIAIIRGKGAGKKGKKKTLYLKNDDINNFKKDEEDWDSDNEEEEDKLFNNLEINYGLMQQYPNTKADRECLYITGPSGSGKSTYASEYIKQYKKAFPNNDFILLSRKPEDPVLDQLKPIRIKIDESLLDDPIDFKELENSCVLFDDIDTISNIKLRDYVQHLRDDILEVGRSSRITCICTSHLACNYKQTRTLLNEATSLVIFPRSGSSYQYKRMLKVYCGLDKKQVQKILNLPSRWVCLHKSYPNYVLYALGAYAIQ